jgi:hypothetical protein
MMADFGIRPRNGIALLAGDESKNCMTMHCQPALILLPI